MSGWSDFICPPRPLDSPAGAMRALCLAMRERYDQVLTGGEFMGVEYLETGDPSNLKSFDNQFNYVAQFYAIEDQTKSASDLRKFRTGSLDVCAEILGERLISPVTDYLSPEWNLKWAAQRYKFVNMLKLWRYPLYTSMHMTLNKNGSAGESPERIYDPYQAANTAFGRMLNDGGYSSTTTISRHLIVTPYISTDLYAYSSRCGASIECKLDIQQFSYYPILSSLLENGKFRSGTFAMIDVVNYNSNTHYDPMGSGLNFGGNSVQIQPDGTIYNNSDISFPADPVFGPDPDRIVEYGFDSSIHPLIDVHEDFEFYADIEGGQPA